MHVVNHRQQVAAFESGVIHMEILVTLKSVYGRDTVYPACPKAQTFAALAGTKTLQPHTLRLIKDLGYTVTVSQPTITL